MPVDLNGLTCSSRIGVPVSSSSARRGSLGGGDGGGGGSGWVELVDSCESKGTFSRKFLGDYEGTMMVNNPSISFVSWGEGWDWGVCTIRLP